MAWHESATVYEPKLNILAYFLTLFIAHLCQFYADFDIEADILLLVFCNDPFLLIHTLFSAHQQALIDCCGNAAYDYFTSPSICSVNFSTQSLPWHTFKGPEASSYEKNAVYTPFWWCICVNLFCIWCLALSLTLHWTHFLSIQHIYWL